MALRHQHAEKHAEQQNVVNHNHIIIYVVMHGINY